MGLPTQLSGSSGGDSRRRAAAEGVLVVEPDAVLRQSIGDSLRRAGFTVLASVESGEEAKPLARRLKPGAVVLGRGHVGAELLEIARALHANDRAAVVLLSPIPDRAWARSARSAGVSQLLGRPPREADLVAAVELALGHREAVRATLLEIDALREELDGVRVVESAQSLLAAQDGITGAAARERLQRQAERSGRTLREVASAVLLAANVASSA